MKAVSIVHAITLSPLFSILVNGVQSPPSSTGNWGVWGNGKFYDVELKLMDGTTRKHFCSSEVEFFSPEDHLPLGGIEVVTHTGNHGFTYEMNLVKKISLTEVKPEVAQWLTYPFEDFI